jgi:hypothetical protein
MTDHEAMPVELMERAPFLMALLAFAMAVLVTLGLVALRSRSRPPTPTGAAMAHAAPGAQAPRKPRAPSHQ